MLHREGGRNRERNCRIPRISPPTFFTKAKVAKGGGAYLWDTTYSNTQSNWGEQYKCLCGHSVLYILPL